MKTAVDELEYERCDSRDYLRFSTVSLDDVDEVINYNEY